MATESIASSVMTSLGGGSGIDILKLARDLTDVEQVPAEERINESKAQTEAKISGLAVLKFNVQELIAEFNDLNDAVELAIPVATSSDTSKVSVTATDGSALTGISDISVSSLAQAQRNVSNQYSSTTQTLNSGGAFSLTITPGSGPLLPSVSLLEMTLQLVWSVPSMLPVLDIPLHLLRLMLQPLAIELFWRGLPDRLTPL